MKGWLVADLDICEENETLNSACFYFFSFLIIGFSLSTANVRPKEKEEELDGIVGDVVSKLMEEEEKLEKIKKIENMNKWFYRDPQGILQGTFFIQTKSEC